MNNKGNRKHLTFEQRVEIEKALTENKSFAEIGRIIGKDSSTISKEVRLHARVKERPDPGYTNPPCIHRKKCKMTCLCDEQCGTMCKICKKQNMRCIDVKRRNVKSLKSRHMYVMDALKKVIVSCQECFILPSMLMMNIAVCLLIAELVSIRLPKAFSP